MSVTCKMSSVRSPDVGVFAWQQLIHSPIKFSDDYHLSINVNWSDTAKYRLIFRIEDWVGYLLSQYNCDKLFLHDILMRWDRFLSYFEEAKHVQ